MGWLIVIPLALVVVVVVEAVRAWKSIWSGGSDVGR